jgi:Recombinase
LSRKRTPSKPEWQKVVENFSRLSKREGVPRDAAEARAWLIQLANELLDNQEKTLWAFRRVVKTARHAVPKWIEPIEPLTASPHLVNWFTAAVKACTSEEPTKGKRRTFSLDVALGLTRPRGRPRDTQGERPRTAVKIHSLREEGKSDNEIADRLQIEDARTVRRIYAAHADAIVKHLIRGPSVPLGYDLKDRKLVVNEAEAATVRMIFKCFAQLAASPAPKRAFTALVRKLKTEGITDKRGKPIDIHRVISNRMYLGETVRKSTAYTGEHEAIVDRALWLKVHRVRRILMAAARRRKRRKTDH